MSVLENIKSKRSKNFASFWIFWQNLKYNTSYEKEKRKEVIWKELLDYY